MVPPCRTKSQPTCRIFSTSAVQVTKQQLLCGLPRALARLHVTEVTSPADISIRATVGPLPDRHIARLARHPSSQVPSTYLPDSLLLCNTAAALNHWSSVPQEPHLGNLSYRSPCRWPYPVIHPAADPAAVPVIHPAVCPAANFHAHHDSSAVRFVRCSSVLFDFVDRFSLPSSPCCDALNPSRSSPYGDVMFVRSFLRCSTPWHVFDCVVSRRGENSVSAYMFVQPVPCCAALI